VAHSPAMRAFVAVGMILAAGCGAGTAARHVAIDGPVSVVVTGNPGSDTAGDDTMAKPDPRIDAAGAAITELLGHGLTYEIDAALGARLGARGHEALVTSMEATVDGLRYAKRGYADAFAFAAPVLKTVSLAYGPSADSPSPVLDPKTGVLRVVVPPQSSVLLHAGDLEMAMVDAFQASSSERFEQRQPEQVPPAEQRAFFKFLSNSPVHARGRGAYETARLDRLGRLARLYDVVNDPALRGDIRARLASDGSTLTGRNTDVDPAAWSAAQGAYVAWVNAHSGELTPADRLKVAGTMLNPGSDTPAAVRRGFDALRFAQPTIATLSPSVGDDRSHPSDERSLEDMIVCPLHDDRGTLRMWSACRGQFYLAVLDQDGGAARLVALLGDAKNDRLTQAAVMHVMIRKALPDALALIDALDDASARVAVKGMAEFDGWRKNAPLPYETTPPDRQAYFAWVRKTWTARPKLRGSLLYSLTRIDDEREGLVPWGRLPTFLGSAITGPELDSYLGQGRRALWNIDLVSRGFSPGWARAPIILPHLERWLAELATYDDGGPWRMGIADNIVDALCRGGNLGDVAALQAFIRARIEAMPAEKNQFGTVLDGPPARVCSSHSLPVAEHRRAPGGVDPVEARDGSRRPPPDHARGDAGVLFGDDPR
jgi:hypothetical protein